MLIGASNLWFPILQSVIVMPMDAGERKQDLADQLRVVLGDKLIQFAGQPRGAPRAPGDGQATRRHRRSPTPHLREAVDLALASRRQDASPEERSAWSPTDLLVPEWLYLQAGRRPASTTPTRPVGSR